jgi:hypothetical protein
MKWSPISAKRLPTCDFAVRRPRLDRRSGNRQCPAIQRLNLTFVSAITIPQRLSNEPGQGVAAVAHVRDEVE